MFLVTKLLSWISNVINAIWYRINKKRTDVRGNGPFGDSKSTRTKAYAFAATILLLALVAVFIKKGLLTSVNDHFDRETAPGAKLPTTIAGSVNKNDLLQAEMKGLDGSQRVDCAKLIANLKSRGEMIGPDRHNFDSQCRGFLSQDMLAIIDKILNKEIPPNAVADVMENTTEENAKDVNSALANENVRESLKGDGSETLAKELGVIGKLSNSEISSVVDKVKNSPPQFRSDIVSAVKATVKLEDPEARSAMIKSINAAKSKEELQENTIFAETLAKATSPDEQKTLAEAFEKAPGIEVKKALSKAAQEVVLLDKPEDAAIRNKLVNNIKETSNLPPDQQKDAYNNIASVAKTYRTTSDPELKKAIGDAIMESRGPEEMAGLSDRVKMIAVVKQVTPIEKDDEVAVVVNKDPETLEKIKAAFALASSGDRESAKKAMKGELTQPEMAAAAQKAASSAKEPFKGNEEKAKIESDVNLPNIEEAVKEERKFAQKKKNAEQKLLQYLKAGIEPGDSKMVEVYKEISESDREVNLLSERIGTMKIALRKKISSLRDKAKLDFAEAGIAFPEMDIKIPEGDIKANTPEERFTNLPELKEFWSSEEGGSNKNKSKYFKFSTGGMGGGEQGASLLGKATKGLGTRDTWYSNGFTSGAGTTNNTNYEFEMSRLTEIKGYLRHVPAECVASKQASSTFLQFVFIDSVANRKTGKIEIPSGSVALCKIKNFENDTGRLYATCNTVDIGGKSDIKVNLELASANGSDGVLGQIRDERGWELAGIFLTAFTASALDGVTAQFVSPYESKAKKAASDYLIAGASGGGAAILQDVATKQIDKWSTANTFWCSYDGALAIIKQTNK